MQHRIPVSLTVVGDGDDLPRLQRLSAELGLTDKVRFAGRTGKDELLKCYADADLFVLASRATSRDVEGFGIVYIEASASGVPVICSAEGGATDAVEEGWNGIIIPSSSALDIAKGMERFELNRDRFPAARVQAFARRFRWPAAAAAIGRELATAV